MKDAVVSLTCGWFIFLSTIIATCPEWVGTWQAQAELAFLNEAERIGMWGE
jgi:hypothetical protein